VVQVVQVVQTTCEGIKGEPLIYFIENTGTKAVKIGRTGNLKKRMKMFKGANCQRLQLLGTIPGGAREEIEMHRRFAARQIDPTGLIVGREWFRGGPNMRRAIERICRKRNVINVGEECRRRDGCRHGLKGIKMKHVPTGQTFTCYGSDWRPGQTLILFSGKGSYDPGFEPKYDEFGMIRASDFHLDKFHPAPIFHALDCVLISPWPVTCCYPE
jgi:hypothetical protein